MERTVALDHDQVRLLLHEHLLRWIGPFLAILFSGGLVTLGTICMILLSSKGQENTMQKRIMRIYVVLVVIIVPALLVDELLFLHSAAFQSLYEQNSNLVHAFTILGILIPAVIMTLTNGLLVWRCFMVQRTLGRNNYKLQALFWIIPMGIWGTIIGSLLLLTNNPLRLKWQTTVTSTTMVGLVSAWQDCETFRPRCKSFIKVAKSIGIIGNAVLNLLATGYIVTRLLIHRQKLIHLHGQGFSTLRHTCIISILLESSAINAPIATFAVVQLYAPVFKTDFFAFVLACQAFMSILIVYQVAIDHAFRRQDEHNLEIDLERVAKGVELIPSENKVVQSCA